MPTYDYQCDACDHEFEIFQRISEDPIKKCPECKKNKLRRLFGTGAAIVFKGSGFYETDYRSESYKKGADAAKEKSKSSEDKKTNGKSETKSGSSSDSSSSGTAGSDKPSKPARKDKSSE